MRLKKYKYTIKIYTSFLYKMYKNINNTLKCVYN